MVKHCFNRIHRMKISKQYNLNKILGIRNQISNDLFQTLNYLIEFLYCQPEIFILDSNSANLEFRLENDEYLVITIFKNLVQINDDAFDLTQLKEINKKIKKILKK